MAIDGIVLQKITKQLDKIVYSKINKIYQVSQTEILLNIKPKNAPKVALFISCHSVFNRIQITNKHYETPYEPSHFTMLLRKHLENGTITSIRQGNLDRYLVIEILSSNEIGDKVVKYLYVELMGKYANVILVDEHHKILDALKRIPPFQNTKRTIQPGAFYTSIENQNKLNPFETTVFDESLSLLEQFSGFSPLLSKEVSYRIANNQSFKEIMKLIEDSDSLYISENTKQSEYHVIPLTHISNSHAQYPLFEGFDELYYRIEEKERIRQQTGDLYKFVNRELKKNANKLPKLNQSLQEAIDCEKWHIYGDLLYAYMHKVEKGQTTVSLPSFENGEDIVIPLDEKLSPKQNAKKCFQKYQKGKKGQIHILEQIEKCEREIEYFTAISQQLDLANFQDAKEIKEELENNGYLKKHIHKNAKQKKKKQEYNFITVEFNDDTTIYIGKNNLQNDYLTWKHSRKSDYWFHAEGYHGAHVLLTCDTPNEEMIRACAMFAAYFSKAKDSSSIAVSYTQVKNLKRVPRSNPGFVSMTSYKTIYIDINLETINHYIKK